MAMSDLYTRVRNLSPDKLEFLSRRLQQRLDDEASGASADGPATPVGGHSRLVAYAVIDGNRPTDASELRGFLEARLPDYMVPSAFVFLDALPLMPNGKIDRNALPDPGEQTQAPEDAFVAPRTPVEQTLADIWAEVLGFDAVGIRDDFFEMGGDSLLSIRIISKAIQAGIRITPEQFFDNPTIAQLAALLDEDREPQSEQGGVTGAVPLTPIQNRFFELGAENPADWGQSVLLEAPIDLRTATLEKAVRYLVAHHDALRLCFEREDAQWRQHVATSELEVSVAEVDLSAISQAALAQEQESIATRMRQRFDYGRGAIVAGAIIRFGASRPPRILLMVHELAVDRVSWRILLEDLEIAYRQLRRGETVELPAKTTSFKVFSERVYEYAHADRAYPELAYWRRPGSRARVPVELEGGAAAHTVGSARTLTVELSAEDTRQLLHDVPAVYQTVIDDVVLTALVQALGGWMGTRAVSLGIERHGREGMFDNVDLSRTVGCFTAFFPVTLDPGGSPEPGACLKAVKEQLRQVPGAGMGYGMLRYLNADETVVEELQAAHLVEINFECLGEGPVRYRFFDLQTAL